MDQIKNLGGLVNQDLAFIKHSPDLVYNSENFVITTDEGGTYTARTVVKGNSELFYLPGIAYKSKIQLDKSVLSGMGYIAGTNYILDFTINGTPYTLRFDFISYEDILYKLYLAILDSKTNNTEWSIISDVKYIFNGSDSFIDISCGLSLNITCDENIFIFSNNYQSNLSDIKIIGWTTIRDDIYLISTNGKFNPDLNELPMGNEYTQIWKIAYDKSLPYDEPLNYTTTLIYNGLLNMTIYRPIANPGMIIGRYENEDIQKIYWTDNYNSPRFINVADPNAFYLTPNQLDLFPKLNISEPRLKEIIQTGNILEGTYQAAYRLSKKTGGETVFSSLSNPIHVVKVNDVTTQYVGSVKSQDPTDFIAGNPSYQGSLNLTTVNKSLLYTINNLDTNYDYVELCIIYRNKYDSIPTTIQIVKKEPINSTSIDLLYTGNESVVQITLDELNSFTTSIKRAKSINTKNNYMFLSNVDASTRILNFDTRAYRFPLNSITTKVYDQFNTEFIIDDTYELSEKHDSIQNYNSQAPTTSDNYIYQYNSNVVGGTGKNLSYKFLSWNECKAAGLYIILDDNNVQNTSTSSEDYKNKNNPNATWNDPTIKSYFPPYKSISRNTKTYNGTNNLGQDFYLNNSFESYVSPYISSLFKTYRRDEMYRFGIQFYDKRGNPYFVKWVADIRMPHIYMPDGSGGKNLDYPLTQYENGVLYAYPLVLQFELDTTSIDDVISGWHVVRSERKDSDKHILHQGAIRPCFNFDDSRWFLHTNDPFSNGLKIGDYQFEGQLMFYTSPEVSFNKKSYVAEDQYVEIVSLLDTTKVFLASNDPHHDYTLTSAFGVYQYNALCNIVKNYEYVNDKIGEIPYSIHNVDAMNPLQIKTLKLFDVSANNDWENNSSSQIDFPFAGKPLCYNYGRDYRQGSKFQTSGSRGILFEIYDDGAGTYDFGSIGGSREIEVSDGWVGLETSSGITDMNFKTYIANCRKNVQGQYGGNTYSARSNSEYIKCSAIVTSGTIVNALQGDVFINVVDMTHNFLNFGHDSDTEHFQTIRFIPLETEINIDLRVGAECADGVYSDYIGLPNREWFRGTNTNDLSVDVTAELVPLHGHISKDEAFNYNYVYSNENNVRKYFPESLLSLDTGKYDVRTYKTAQKTNGENGESWSDIKEEAYIEVDSSFGPINNTILFKDKIYFIQDKGFGVFQIGEQRLQQNDADQNLILGSAGILERFDYLSTKTGSKHQFSFSVSDYSMLWFDTLARKIIRYTGEGLQPLSDIRGLSAHFYNRINGNIQTIDNPYIGKGIHSTYDYRFNRHLMTFLNEDDQTKITIMYNEPSDGFEGFLSCYPEVYINDKLNIFTIPYTNNSTQDLLYIQNYGAYGTFFGRTYPSVISTVINENPTEEKVLTNLEIIADGYSLNSYSSPQYDPVAEINRSEFFDLIRVYNSYQNTDYQGLSNLSRRHKTIWNVKVPSDRVKTVNSNIFNPSNLEVNRPALTRRMKDKWFMVDLIYNNTNNKKFVAQTLKGIYSMNSR